MLAVIVVRDGTVPAGAGETISECDGRAALVGSGTAAAAVEAARHRPRRDHVRGRRLPPGAWTEALSTHFDDEPILVLPASPDGRDLAPRLAAQLQRPLYADVHGSVAVADRPDSPSRHRAALGRAARSVRRHAAARRARCGSHRIDGHGDRSSTDRRRRAPTPRRRAGAAG